jgi:hypothetical protein
MKSEVLSSETARLLSIRISASLETISETCFRDCSDLEPMRCESGSKLSLTKENAVSGCRSLGRLFLSCALVDLSDSSLPDAHLTEIMVGAGSDMLRFELSARSCSWVLQSNIVVVRMLSN